MDMYRTKTCGELRIKNVGEQVELAGWIQKIRNLGGMIFIDLRDEFGITQIVVNDEKLQEMAKELNSESCIHIDGKIVERTNKNPKIPTGEIEVLANDRSGLLVDVLTALKDAKTNLVGVNTKTTKERIAIMKIDLEVENTQELNRVIKFIRKVDSVYEVRRKK